MCIWSQVTFGLFCVGSRPTSLRPAGCQGREPRWRAFGGTCGGYFVRASQPPQRFRQEKSCISSQSTLDQRPCGVCRGELRVVPGSHHGKTMTAGGTLVRRAAEETVGDGVANEVSAAAGAQLLPD